MLTALAFCPAPPLLVPALAAGAAAELDGLRAACAESVRRVLGTAPDEIVVIATGRASGWFRPGTTGTLAGFGVPVTATLPGPARAGSRRYVDYEPWLPLEPTIGAWLLTGAGVPCSALMVGPDVDPVELAASLDRPDRRALLVMGDGSARRSEAAPGYVDPRAAGFDATVAAALRAGDANALWELDPVLGADLLAAGVPAWRVAGHAASTPGPAAAPDPAVAPDPAARPGSVAWDAELLYDDAPYGVGYLVAAWLRR